jgi:hypothetical protein
VTPSSSSKRCCGCCSPTRPTRPPSTPFPERRHIAALIAAFVTDYLLLIERWSEFARDEIRQWPHTDGLGMTDRTREILNTVLDGKSALEPER